ncbi:glycosyltransferase [Vreelandella alkaliphila]|uniref:Glycosyltransferase n=1 Tax=Vreelandella alkaliphila TaxID=272774 RepID=A0AAJ2RYH4_9GAMM|nr:glycosyltransferase [Halomonas alkaliphila]MDX5976689.1 glycosyltransferase [Halomonas alkaliphila]
MDDLLRHAQQLASQASTPIVQPIEGRLAYVVNEGHSASNGSTQQLAEALNQRGLEALCIVRPGWPWDQTEGNPHITPEADINGVRYLHSMLPSSALGGARATLEATVEKLVKLLRVYRPAAVLAETADVGLAAWIAAKRLGLAFFGVESNNHISGDVVEPKSLFVAKQALHLFVRSEQSRAALLRSGVAGEAIERIANQIEDQGLPNISTQCIAKLLRGGRPGSKKSVTTAKADDLIDLAYRLIETKYAASSERIKGRVAVVVNHGQKNISKGYAKRTQKLFALLCENDYGPVFIEPFDINKNNSVPKLSAYMQENTGMHYDSSEGGGAVSSEAYLKSRTEYYSNHFKEVRPEAVIVSSDFSVALPAIIAAKQLSLPVMKEHLHYADAFLDELKQPFFELMSFAEQFRIEQICFNLSNHRFYLFYDDERSCDAFLSCLNEAVQRKETSSSQIKIGSKKAHKISLDITVSGLYCLEFDVEDEVGGDPRGVVASFRFFDDSGSLIKEKLPGFSASKAYSHYQYIDTNRSTGTAKVSVFSIPIGIVRVEVDIVAFVAPRGLKLSEVFLRKVSVADSAAWLTRQVPGLGWVKLLEPFVHKEGAASLRLALLSYKYELSKHRNDLAQLNGAILEMVELNRTWLPEIAYFDKQLNLPVTNKLTVAHLHKTAYPYENTGGAIRCLNTALSQQRIGIDPYIITPIGYPRFAGVEGVKNHEIIEGIEHFRVGANTDGLRGLALPDRTNYSAFHIAKILKARGASLIHAASGVRGYELALQALALKKLTGLPLLYEVRSFHEHTWTPVRSDVMDLERTELRVIKENFCMEEADFVTTISYSMKKILIERGVRPDRIEVIPNAIDESKYLGKVFESASIPMLEGADFIVGYISNMSRREGHKYLIEAIHQLRHKTGLDIRGLLVGNGPERASLEDLSAKLGMKDIICFPGEIDHNEINAYYKAIDLFVIPRIPDYAADWVTPLKPYEAMALERPIIVTDLPALQEIVGKNEERGLVAKPADVESLVEKLKLLIEDSTLRESKVATAKQWVFAERTWSANAKRYESIYRRLIEENVTAREVLDA